MFLNVDIAIDKITTGDIDVNPPYGDGEMKQAAQESLKIRKSTLQRIIREEIKKLNNK